MKKALLYVFLAILANPTDLHAYFERAALGTRPASMGGMFTPLGDDASTLFMNVAGLVTIETTTLYGEFAEEFDTLYGGESRAGIVYTAPWFSAGVGWYGRGFAGGGDENVLVAGIARNVITNMQGSFLSVGLAAKVGRISYGTSCACSEGGASQTEMTVDLGIMLRPLPVISIGYAVLNARKVDFALSGTYGSWEPVHRWGICYFWGERVVFGYEQEHVDGRTVNHYGFAVRTSTPIELLAGFAEEKVYGGIRWAGETVRVSVAFEPNDGNAVHARASVELALRFGDRD
jgi:hypothetical protein